MPTENVHVSVTYSCLAFILIFFVFKINPSTGVINFSEEVGKTFLWKSIAKSKDKEAVRLEKKPSNNDKPSRGSGIKERFVIQ